VRRPLVARLWQSLVVVAIVTTISFALIHSVPGDPFSYENSRISPAMRDQLRAQAGFDKPLPEQFVRYLWNLLHGWFGYSIPRHQPVADLLATTIPRTLLLAGLSLALSVVLGVIVGVLQAARRDGWFDRVSSGVLLFFYSLPDFWAALMAALVFAQWWGLFPASGMTDAMHDYMAPWPALVDRLRHLVLPVATLTLLTVAGIARYQRAAMLEVLPLDFVRAARAKGVPERDIVWRHALRTALTPMVTLLGVLFPALLGGSVFIERVFQWPGMGLLAVSAIASRDYDVVTATVIVGSLMVIIGNLLADLLHAALDPRVRA
jgi:peptide/nickel transport system permease protein